MLPRSFFTKLMTQFCCDSNSAPKKLAFCRNTFRTLIDFLLRVCFPADVLNTFIAMSKFLEELPSGQPLVRHFCDFVLFNPALWIHSNPKVGSHSISPRLTRSGPAAIVERDASRCGCGRAILCVSCLSGDNGAVA